MAKGAQNRNSKLAYEHAKKSIGKKRTCNGIYHKGYLDGDFVDSSLFKRQGEGYQAFCSDCDQARQNLQKTLKRVAAIVFANKEYRIALPSEYKKQEVTINQKIIKALRESKSDIQIYTNLVVGNSKLNIKELELYESKLSVESKKKLIKIINDKVRNSINDKLVKEKIKKIGFLFKFQCSMCKSYLPVKEIHPNISQSRDVFDRENILTGYKLPLHNLCDGCSKGNRAEAIRHYKFLCDGDFIEATKKMTSIGKKNRGDNIDADHIIPLRLGGKHDPMNIRPLPKKNNIAKKDKLTNEVMLYLDKNNISLKALLTSWYHKVYERAKNENIKIIEASLRFAVDSKRNQIKELSFEYKKKELLKLYPTLNTKELTRIIKKCFS
jgi:hypothetical protein